MTYTFHDIHVPPSYTISLISLQYYEQHPPSDGRGGKEPSKRTKFYNRFYSAIILFSLIQERPLDKVIEKMDLTRGAIRQLQLDAGMSVCMCVCLSDCMYVFMHVCMFVCMFVCLYAGA